jgi:hypothetical protein
MSTLKSAKEILENLGFKKDAPESTQLAFLRYLKREMTQSPRPEEPPPSPEQLEFDLDESGLKSGTSS